jgi:hypothetical protein
MKVETKIRKNAINGFRQAPQGEILRQNMHEIIQVGTAAMNDVVQMLGRLMVETILTMEREEMAGPDYAPRQAGVYKWAWEPGSVYLGDQKIKVSRPRLRGPEGATWNVVKSGF